MFLSLSLYFALIFSLIGSRYFSFLTDFVPVVLLSPLLFFNLEKMGLFSIKRGIIYGITFSAVYFPFINWETFFSLKTLDIFFLAFCEEIFFRGYLLNVFKMNSFHKKNILVSVLFTLPHLIFSISPDRFLVFLPSLLFGYLYFYTRTVWSSTIFHFFSNIFFMDFFGRFVKTFLS